MLGQPDYLDEILRLAGGGDAAPALRGAPPPLPTVLQESQPSPFVTVPQLQTGQPAPGESFGDRWALGFDGAQVPRANGYQSDGAQFITALLGQALKSAANSRLHSIDERQRTQDALAANTRRMNEANADLTRRMAVEREQGVQARATKRQEAAARATEDEAKWKRDHPLFIDTTLARRMRQPTMAGMPVSVEEHTNIMKALDARDRRDNFDPSVLSKGDQQRLANLRQRADRVQARADHFYGVATSTNTLAGEREAARAQGVAQQQIADGLFAQIDALLAKGQPPEPPQINRNGALPDFAPFKRGGSTTAAAPAAPAPAAPAATATAPAPASRTSSAVGTPEEETNKILGTMMQRGITNADEASRFLQANQQAVKDRRVNTRVIMAAFGKP